MAYSTLTEVTDRETVGRGHGRPSRTWSPQEERKPRAVARASRASESIRQIILTDFTMPGLTGWEVARTVKSVNPRVPVVVVIGGAHDVAPHQRAAVAAIIETPCGLTILHIGIRLLTGTPVDPVPCGPPLAGA